MNHGLRVAEPPSDAGKLRLVWSMRLLYLLVDDLDPQPTELERLTTFGQGLMPTGTFTVSPISFGPSEYYESAAGFALCVPGVIHAVRSWQDDYDAIVIGCFGDPGLRAARTVARVPVVGGCEASVALSHSVAQRFGIVTVETSDIPEIAARLAELEASQRCVGIGAIETPFHALMDDPAETSHRLEQASRPLLAAGAQAIILGCMSFGFGTFDRDLEDAVGVPVLNPVRASIAAASAMHLLGASVSPRWIAPIQDSAALDEYLGDIEVAFRTRHQAPAG